MWDKVKWVAIFICIIFCFILIGYLYWQKANIEELNKELEQRLMEADLTIGRAETKFGDANRYILELEDQIQEDIKKHGALLTRYGIIEAKYNILAKQVPAETTVEYCDVLPINTSSEEFVPGLLYEAITEKTIVPISYIDGISTDNRIKIDCTVKPYPNDNRDIPFIIGYQLRLRISGILAETVTPTGAVNHYLSLFEVDEKDNHLNKLELTKFEVITTDERESQFFWWAPVVDIGAFGAYRTTIEPIFGGSIGFSPSGYGLTPQVLSWRFLRISTDVSKTLGFGITPVLWNLGDVLPLINNLWLGPHYSLDIEGHQAFGIFIGAAL